MSLSFKSGGSEESQGRSMWTGLVQSLKDLRRRKWILPPDGLWIWAAISTLARLSSLPACPENFRLSSPHDSVSQSLELSLSQSQSISLSLRSHQCVLFPHWKVAPIPKPASNLIPLLVTSEATSSRRWRCPRQGGLPYCQGCQSGVQCSLSDLGLVRLYMSEGTLALAESSSLLGLSLCLPLSRRRWSQRIQAQWEGSDPRWNVDRPPEVRRWQGNPWWSQRTSAGGEAPAPSWPVCGLPCRYRRWQEARMLPLALSAPCLPFSCFLHSVPWGRAHTLPSPPCVATLGQDHRLL